MKRTIAAVLLCLASACDGSPAPAPSPSPSPTAETLPGAVEATRREIIRAARAFDYDALTHLSDAEGFTYSFGESGDPVGYWRRLESEGHVPVLGDIIPSVLSTTFALRDGIYVWPAAAAKDPDDWSARDIRELKTLTSEEDIDTYRRAGGYLGWRAGIAPDGTWRFLVAGD